MQQHNVRTDTASAISRYFAKAHLATQQETWEKSSLRYSRMDEI